MNFMVLQGLVNQKKDVSGRLLITKDNSVWLKNCFYSIHVLKLNVKLHFPLFTPTKGMEFNMQLRKKKESSLQNAHQDVFHWLTVCV